jgi:hypothetical protein
MIKLILEITRNNLFKYKKPESSPQKSLKISCQSVLIQGKISGTFYAKSREKQMKFDSEKFEGNQREFFTRVRFNSV